VKNWNILIHVEPEEKARIAYQVALTGKNLGEFVKELILDAVKEKEVNQAHEVITEAQTGLYCGGYKPGDILPPTPDK